MKKTEKNQEVENAQSWNVKVSFPCAFHFLSSGLSEASAHCACMWFAGRRFYVDCYVPKTHKHLFKFFNE